MSALTPTDAASCRAMALECGRRAQQFADKSDMAGAGAQIERARQLCLLALKFEQDSPPSTPPEGREQNT
jgi:hypothetical protein